LVSGARVDRHLQHSVALHASLAHLDLLFALSVSSLSSLSLVLSLYVHISECCSRATQMQQKAEQFQVYSCHPTPLHRQRNTGQFQTAMHKMPRHRMSYPRTPSHAARTAPRRGRVTKQRVRVRGLFSLCDTLASPISLAPVAPQPPRAPFASDESIASGIFSRG